MRRSLVFPGAALVAALFSLGATAGEIEPTGLYALPGADVVVLGEIHDNPVHHAHQAIALGEIGPRAVVFEMLSENQASRITERLLASEEALGAVLGWEASGWPDFGMYYPVFVAAGDAAFVGAAAPIGDVRRATQDGAAVVFGEEAGRFALDRALPDTEQLLREAEQLSAHCGALPASRLPGMVEAQRLRDGWLARAALDAVARFGSPVAVIAGNGHARRDWGVPRLIAAADPALTVLSVGQFETRAEAAPPFDLWLVTDPAEREDPCEVFRR